MRRKTHIATATALVVVGAALVASNIHPNFKFGWGENIGWLNWRDADGGTSGVVVHETFLSGFIWAENVGWINVGDGTPADGVHYANTDDTDFGVNIDVNGDLFGLGWGENIGWINFDTASLGADRARYDPATLAFSGYAWGENVGWIGLGGVVSFADCNSNGWPDDLDIADGHSPDYNTNGIPDECEVLATFYVDDDSLPGGDGTSWSTAFNYLQDALAAVTTPGTAIRVAQGTYKPDQGGSVTSGEPTETFELQDDVAIYGGYRGLSGGGSANERNVETFVTTLSGDLGGENSYHVMTASNVGGNAVLDGFTITGGNADDVAFPHERGGGMYISGGGPRVTNCTFYGNSARYYGGGMCNENSSSLTVTNCTFNQNIAGLVPYQYAYGGGMYNVNSTFSLSDCTFSGNSATRDGGGMVNAQVASAAMLRCTFNGNSALGNGGGMYNYDFSSPALTQCAFTDNSANFGGGMYNYWLSSPTLDTCEFDSNESSGGRGGGMGNSYYSAPVLLGCTFRDNESRYRGGGMYNEGSSPTLTNCTFEGNQITEFAPLGLCSGGGMHNEQDSDPVLTACIFRANVATKSGAGVYNFGDSADPTLINCLFSGNSAGEYGGGLCTNKRCAPTLVNCTFAGNSAAAGGRASACDNTYGTGHESDVELVNCILWDGGDEVWNATGCTTTITYSDVQSTYPGAGNIDADPLFADPGNADYHLTAGSPCVNAGNDAAVGLPAYDFEGDDRIRQCRVDMGVDETPFFAVDCNGNGMDDLCDIIDGASFDCNTNGIPDECDIAGGTSQDQNVNGTPDDCEVVNLTRGTAHATIPEAIAQALNGDELLAAAPRFAVDLNIDFDEKAITLRSAGPIQQPGGGSITMADESALAAAAGRDITLAGSLLVEFGDRAEISADEFAVTSTGSLTLSAASLVDAAAAGGAELGGTARVDASAALGFSGPLINSKALEVYGGTIAANGFTNEPPDGSLTAYGDFMTNVTNDDEVTIIADAQVVGDYTNNGTTTVQNGTLTISGTLTNNGTIIGDTSGGSRYRGLPRAAGDGLTVLGDYVAGAAATLWMVSSDLTVRIGGDFDVAINDPARFNLTAATLQMIGLPDDGPQALEVMAENLGRGVTLPDPSVFSVKKLRIGPTATTVNLVDLHDNAGGAGSEALYVEDLILEPGITVDVAGLEVYYVTVTPADPSDPGSGVTIIDSVGGGGLIDSFPPFNGDFDGDGDVDLDDYEYLPDCLAGPDTAPIPPGPVTAQDCLDAFDFDIDADVDLMDYGEFQMAFTGEQ